MEISEKMFEKIAIREADVIENLTVLCRYLLSRLSVYTDISEEEKQLQNITKCEE